MLKLEWTKMYKCFRSIFTVKLYFKVSLLHITYTYYSNNNKAYIITSK